jgi:high potential iron-sulfur protein
VAEKVSKASVKYGEGGDHCGACRFFIESAEDEKSETGACQKVAGAIAEDMWCRLFKRKAQRTIAGGGGYDG